MGRDPGEPEPDSPPVIDYASPGQQFKSKSGWSIVKLGFVLFWFCAVIFAVFQSMNDNSRGRGHNRIKCQTNLSWIGRAIMLYGNEYKGNCPPNLGCLLSAEDLPAEVMICPSSDDVRAEGTPEEVARAINIDPACSSYIYLGAGKMLKDVPPGFVMAYEKTLHRDGGMNVLLGDGHVEYIDAPRARAFAGELKAGHNPPRASVVGR